MNKPSIQPETEKQEVKTVGALPALPNPDVPVGTVLRLSINGRLYRCEGEKWMPVEEDNNGN